MADDPLDFDHFERELLSRVPAGLRIIFEEYEPLRAKDGLMVLLPTEWAAHFALGHQRQPDGNAVGIRPSDGVTILPSSLPASSLRERIQQLRPDHLLAILAPVERPKSSTDATPALMSRQAESVETCVRSLPPQASMDLILHASLLREQSDHRTRRCLLSEGRVTDLFDGGVNWYVGWLAEKPDAPKRTQVVKIPAPDQWPEFRLDLGSSVLLWRWGYLTTLPESRPWVWEEFVRDYLSMLLRLKDELERSDPSTMPESAAYGRVAFVEWGLAYLGHLRLGDDLRDFLPILRASRRDDVASRWAQEGGRGVPGAFFNLIDWKDVITAAWDAFGPAFETPTGGTVKQVVARIDSLNDVRNRVMHSVRLASQPLGQRDLDVLDECVGMIDEAIARAELLDYESRRQ